MRAFTQSFSYLPRWYRQRLAPPAVEVYVRGVSFLECDQPHWGRKAGDPSLHVERVALVGRAP